MTACTNNGGKARRVVTAALVGVLSVGAVPAIALATGDVSLQAVSPWADAFVSSANDGQGSSVSADALETGVEFELGDNQYLVPTHIKTSEGAEPQKVKSNWDVTYTGGVATDSDQFTGLVDGWTYLIDGDEEKPFTYDASAGLDAEQARSYFTGTLTGSKEEKITVKRGTYTVTVDDGEGNSLEQKFSIVKPKAEEHTYTVSGNLTYSGRDLKDEISFTDEDGNVIKGDSTASDPSLRAKVTWARGNGQSVPNVKNAGSYVATVTVNGVTTKVNVEIAKLDLSSADVTVSDIQSSTGSVSNADVKRNVLVNGHSIEGEIFAVDHVVDPDGFKYGENKVVFKAAATEDDANIEGKTGEVTFYVYKRDVAGTATIKYGDMTVGSDLYINAFKGESFDASQVSLVGSDDTVYSGDQIEVTVDDATDTVYVRVKPDQKDRVWYGGSTTFQLHVTGADLDANQRLYFYLDGELAGDEATVTYDGEDWLDRLEVVVKDADGNEIDPSNYDVKVTKGGKEVDSATDAGTYKVQVTGKTFDFDVDTDADFDLTVNKLSVDKVEVVADLEASDASYLTWTGEELTPDFKFYDYVDGEYVEVEVPAEAYEVSYDLYEKVTSDNTTRYRLVKKDVALKDEGLYKPVFETAVDVDNYDLDSVATDYVTVTKKGVFLDVPTNEWYSQGVYEAAKLGYMNGDGGGKTFSPMREFTRAEAACVLFNMAGGNALYENLPGYDADRGIYETGFSDVEGSEFFAKAVAWCKTTGVINGYADGTFGVSRKVTNEEFACMLANYAKAKGEDVTVEDADATLAEYPDASVVSDWAKDAVAWCVSEGIMGGGANISPAGSILRMRAATMAVNAQPEALDEIVIPVYPIQ